MHPTVLITSPYFAKKVAFAIKENGVKPSLKKIICGSEALTKNSMEIIKRLLPVEVYNSYGLSECFGPCIAMSCGGDGLHYWNDTFLFEIVDPVTLKPVNYGEFGELVITTFNKEGLPLIRFNTHDITAFVKKNCGCKSRYPMIAPIQSRSDNLIKYKGVFLSEESIANYVSKYCASEYFQLVISQDASGHDHAELSVECRNPDKECTSLEKSFKMTFGVSVVICTTELNTLHEDHKKLKRIIDLRK